MIDRRTRYFSNVLLLLHRPLFWIVTAATVRIAALCSLAIVGRMAAINPQVGEQWKQKANERLTFMGFLNRRVYYRPLTEDEVCYDEMAHNIVAGRGFVLDRTWQITVPGAPAMYAGCGYPLFLALIYWLFGAGNELPVYIVQIGLHALCIWLLFETAERIMGGWAGLAASAFFTFHPMLIWSAVAMMTEAIVVPLVVLFFWLLSRYQAEVRSRSRQALVVSSMAVVLAFLCLTRSPFAYFVPIITVLAWRTEKMRSSSVRALLMSALLVGVFLAVVAPWAVRNYVHCGRLVLFSTKRGCNAYVFNHDGLKVEFGPGVVTGRQPVNLYGPEMQSLPDESSRDAKCMELFLSFIRRHPWKFAGLTWMRFWIAVLPVAIVAASPFATVAAWYIKGTVLFVVPVGLVSGLWRQWRRLVPWFVFVGYWQAMQAVSGPGLRHRLPADPVWALIVGASVSVILTAPSFRSWYRNARRFVLRELTGRLRWLSDSASGRSKS